MKYDHTVHVYDLRLPFSDTVMNVTVISIWMSKWFAKFRPHITWAYMACNTNKFLFFVVSCLIHWVLRWPTVGVLNSVSCSTFGFCFTLHITIHWL